MEKKSISHTFMDKKSLSCLREIKRRSFFSTLFKSTTALLIMNSFPFKLFSSSKSVEKSFKIEVNHLAVKRNRRG